MRGSTSRAIINEWDWREHAAQVGSRKIIALAGFSAPVEYYFLPFQRRHQVSIGSDASSYLLQSGYY
jgi:hypothetical protein